jgi:hypothetical protein
MVETLQQHLYFLSFSAWKKENKIYAKSWTSKIIAETPLSLSL